MTGEKNRTDESPRAVEAWLGHPVAASSGLLAPPAILAAIYAVAMAVGTLALASGWATTTDIGWGRAAFTAISATTVTGLSIVDIARDLTPAGQAVIVVLMQIGGLGLLTFGVLALGMIGGSGHTSLFRADLPLLSGSKPRSLALRVLVFAGAAQAVGTAAMAPGLMREAGGIGLWQAAFQAASAFNNAGFTIIGGVAGQPALLLAVTAALFVVGGFGFAALSNLRDRILGRDALHLHTRVVLWGTALLIALGWGGIALAEWSNPQTLGAQPEGARAGLALFQALTPRTAGFDAVGTDGLTGAGQGLTIALMLIGAGATSTGGGLKVGTVLLLVVAGAALVRHGGPMRAGDWRIPTASLWRIARLVAVALGLVAAAGIAIWQLGDHAFGDALFEAASAFGTVGLTSGVTEAASGWERAILCMLMFLGRIGPLTLAWLLASRFIGPPDADETTLPLS